MSLEDLHILISIDARYVGQILLGKKTVELRRRTLRAGPGTILWIYSKLPNGAVEAVAVIEQVVEAAPSRIWRKLGTQTGISKPTFEDYFSGVSKGCAIVLRGIRPVQPRVPLRDLRRASPAFHPPQFAKVLSPHEPTLQLLLASCR